VAGSAGGRVARELDRRQRSVTTQVLWVRPATPMTEEDQLTTPNIPGPVSRQPEPVSGKRVAIDAPRLWGGGVATAVVAALAAGVGVLVCRDLLHVKLVEPPLLNVTKSFAANYAVTAFVVALAATGLAHLLSVATPRPRVFFGWIVGLITVAAMVVPFALEGTLEGKICASVINLVIGLCIASLLSAVLSRTVVDAERTWQRP